jgi:ABC-2 type transport system permease protein
MLLSDFVFPVLNMPPALQTIAYIIPAKYFIDILKGIYMKNLGITYLWPSFAVLFVMAALLAILNVVVLKREGM